MTQLDPVPAHPVPPVLGVLSGCGGAGASTLAALSAWSIGPALLVDADPLGGGLDVLLGCEQLPGPRWGQVRLRGGPLDPLMLLETLPAWGEVRFLAADGAAGLNPAALTSIVLAASAQVPVVLDLPRAPSDIRAAGLAVCRSVAVVTPAEVRGVTATALLAPALDPSRCGVVVRGGSRSLPASHVGELLGLPVWARLPYDPAAATENGLQPQKIRRRTRAAVAELWREVDRHRGRPVPPAGTGDAA